MAQVELEEGEKVQKSEVSVTSRDRPLCDDQVSTCMRFRSLWVMIGWMMLAIGVLVSLFTPPSLNMGLDATGKDLHWVFYFVSMAWFGQLHNSTNERLMIAAALAILGIGIEGLQSLGGERVASFSDVIANLIGIGCGWLALATPLNGTLLWLDRRLATALRQ